MHWWWWQVYKDSARDCRGMHLLNSSLSNTRHDLQLCDLNICPQMSKGLCSEPGKLSSVWLDSPRIPELMCVQQAVILQQHCRMRDKCGQEFKNWNVISLLLLIIGTTTLSGLRLSIAAWNPPASPNPGRFPKEGMVQGLVRIRNQRLSSIGNQMN